MTRPQHLEALDKANRMRLARADLKGLIAKGDRTVAQVLLDPPEYIANMKIVELLMAQRRWGIRKARKMLQDCGEIHEHKTIEKLTLRQRARMAETLVIRYGE